LQRASRAELGRANDPERSTSTRNLQLLLDLAGSRNKRQRTDAAVQSSFSPPEE